MPPRKSETNTSARFVPDDDVADTSTASAAAAPAGSSTPGDNSKKGGGGGGGGGGGQQAGASESKESVTIDDLNLPKSIITRLAKGVLPPNTQVQTNAILAMRQSATTFISYLASHANENTQNSGKKTIMPADVFAALDDVEFGFFRSALEAEFTKYAQVQSAKRTSYRQKVAAAKRAATGTTPRTSTGTAGTAGHADDNTEPDDSTVMSGSKAKKPRVSASADAEDDDVDDAETEPEDDVEEDEEEEDEDEDEVEDEDEEEETSEVEGVLEEREERVDDDDDSE